VFKFKLWILSLIMGAVFVSPNFSNAQHPPHVPGELLIGPKAGVSDLDLEDQYKAHGGKKIKAHSQIRVHHIKVPEHTLEAVEAALRNNPKVEFVEKNFLAESTLAPNDPSYPNQWHLARIATPGAWDITTGSSGVIIAVLDTGIDTQHPDLPNTVPGKNFIDGSNNVYDNGVNSGHGTAVAGTAAATGNNGIGVSGVSWKNSIMPLVVIDTSAYSPYSVIAAAINYAADHGAKVINMSLAGSSYSSTLQNAVNYAWNKGAVIVAAAANNASSTPMYPAALDNVLAVSATDNYDKPASFTNFGNWIDVAAPGVSIRTTMLGGGYGNWNGTSFATPQVAGLAALIFSANPKLTNVQVVDIIKKNADDLGSAGFDPYYGSGRINAQRALIAVGSVPSLFASISSPSNGATVSGIVPVSVNASSTNVISKVDLFVDGVYYASDTGSPYTFNFYTTGLSGTHTLQAKAYDSTGSVSSSIVSVNVNNATTPADTTPPNVQITGVFYDGRMITITATVSDQNGQVVKVDFYVNGILKVTDTTAPWSAKVNAKPLKTGNQQIQVKAYDAAGNVGISGTMAVATN
jgi:subtilisin family serine protease